MLLLLKDNVVRIAHAFSLIKQNDSASWEKIKRKWYMYGGDDKHLDKAVDEGKNKNPFLQNLIDDFNKGQNTQVDVSDDTNVNVSTGNQTAQSIGSEVANAVFNTFLLVKVISLIPSPDPATKSVAIALKAVTIGLKDMGGEIKTFASNNGATESEVNKIPHLPINFKKH